ncbi:T9SS type A sorting domain-containing protein [bacterium]|nr:T9SS type A sorting domain-containing protein [bacterium]
MMFHATPRLDSGAGARYVEDGGTISGGERKMRTAGRPILCVAAALLAAAAAYGEIIEETGSLRQFLAGEEEGCAYDNWVTHTVEGDADDGYNDYGPPDLDPQTDGFGSYRHLPDNPYGNNVRQMFAHAFQALIRENLPAVEYWIADSVESWRYELVRFHDTEYGREYFMLREQLDSSFVDESYSSSADDDVIGSFRNGWGIYIWSPDAERANTMIQMVHPNDDFFGIVAAIDMFLRFDAGALTIHGTGRSVHWTEEGNYTNAKSLADPSRTGLGLLNVFQEVFVDSMEAAYPDGPIVWQIHSFDQTHDNISPVVCSAGQTIRNLHQPLRDVTNEHLDFIHMTPREVIPENTFGTHPAVEVNDYYWLNYEVGDYFYYHDEEGNLLIPRATRLRGDPGNQNEYRIHLNYRHDRALENFIHIEVQEYPWPLQGHVAFDDLLGEERPPVYETYQPLLDFYEPFFAAVEDWYESWEADDTTPPGACPDYDVDHVSESGEVTVSWEGVEDGHFIGYEIVADTTELSVNSPVVWSYRADRRMAGMNFGGPTQFDGLAYGAIWRSAVRGVDASGNRSELSPMRLINLATHQDTLPVNALPILFDEFPLAAWPAWPTVFIGDPEEVDTVSVVMLSPARLHRQGLQPVQGRYWSASFDGIDAADLAVGDTLKWHIRTRDRSATGNPARMPEEGWYEFVLTDDPVVPLMTGFEPETTDDWIVDDAWEFGQPFHHPDSAFAGDNIAQTNLNGRINASTLHRLQSPALDLRGHGPFLLTFRQWFDYEIGDWADPGYAGDGGFLQIRTDVGDPLPLEPIAPYTHRLAPMSNPASGHDAYSGEGDRWSTVVVDLRSMFGTVGRRLEWVVATDGNDASWGWGIDEVALVREVNNERPQPFALGEPRDFAQRHEARSDFSWYTCVDEDPYSVPLYSIMFEFQGETDEVFVGPDTSAHVIFDSLAFSAPRGGQLTWRVRAVSQGDTTESTEYRRVVSGAFNSVEEHEDGLPREFALGQAYPNPFNASVTVRYALPEQAFTELEVFNLLGRRVAVLGRRVHEAGWHSVRWDGTRHASGLYFVRMRAGSFTASKKLILLK